MKLSVVIPCHNAAAYVGQTLGSLMEQTRPPDEIVVVVDRSTDESAAIARSFGSGLQVYEVDFGQASKTRNWGADRCTGEALLFLDADDVLSPDALAGLEAALAKEPAGVAALPWKRLEQSEGKWVERRASIPQAKRGLDLLSGWLTGRYYPPCCLLWSREAFRDIGGWSEEFCPNDDGDLAMRALVEEIPFVFAEQGLAYYRRVPALASLSGKRFTKPGLEARLRVIEKLGAWLEERGRLARYRYPLTYAFEEIQRDAESGGFDTTAARCRQLRRQFGISDFAWRRRRRLDRVGMGAARLRGRGLRAVARMMGRYNSEPEERVIVYGLATAEEAARRRARGEAGHGLSEAPALPPAPAVSVIIPTYNRAELVCRAIRSVLAQTFTDFELLVVDDASRDDTPQRVQAIGDPRIRYLRQPENRDVSAARNRGLREARGAFIAFLDSDDEWLPDKLEAQISRFRSLPESVGLMYAGSITRFEDGRELVFRPERRGRVFEDLLLKNITDTGSASVVIRRNVVRVVGFFDERIPAMEDYDYWIRVARFFEFDFIERPLARYHEARREDRRSLVRRADIEARRRLFQKYRSALKHAGLTHRFLLISARRRLSRFQRPDRVGALSLALRAAMANPSESAAYRLAVRSLVPGRALDAMGSALRGVRRKSAT